MIDVNEFQEWLKYRPQIIKDLAEKLPPWNKYRIKDTGQHCVLYSYSENGTVCARIIGHDLESLNAGYESINITVFGLLPDTLELLENEQE